VLPLVLILLAAPWWGKIILSRMAYFRVRQVEIRGAHFVDPAMIVARMRVDSLRSIWTETESLRRRLVSHPQISSVTIERKLPSTLLVTIRENVPVALVPTPQGLQAFDSTNRLLPIDPRLSAPDLPILLQRDSISLALLGRIQAYNPALYKRISDVRRTGANELLLTLDSLRVRVPLGVTVTRLTDIFPVESDLKHRQAKVAELDLRYRDQVIARLQ
jgi:cell division protein FtsQ